MLSWHCPRAVGWRLLLDIDIFTSNISTCVLHDDVQDCSPQAKASIRAVLAAHALPMPLMAWTLPQPAALFRTLPIKSHPIYVVDLDTTSSMHVPELTDSRSDIIGSLAAKTGSKPVSGGRESQAGSAGAFAAASPAAAAEVEPLAAFEWQKPVESAQLLQRHQPTH